MGKPIQGNAWIPRLYVGGITQGSETSQYLEEKKPKGPAFGGAGIPSVAASERGRA